MKNETYFSIFKLTPRAMFFVVRLSHFSRDLATLSIAWATATRRRAEIKMDKGPPVE